MEHERKFPFENKVLQPDVQNRYRPTFPLFTGLLEGIIGVVVVVNSNFFAEAETLVVLPELEVGVSSLLELTNDG